MKQHLVLVLVSLIVVTGCSSKNEAKPLVDPPKTPEMELVRSAMEAYDQGLFSVSKTLWSELRDGYPGSYYATLAELKLADSLFQLSDYPAALIQYEEFSRVHPGHEAIPYVRYQIGNCQLKQYQGARHDQSPLQTAVRTFRSLIDTFGQSEYAVLAKRRIVECRELLAEHERYVAGFYRDQGLVDAALGRYARLKLVYPDTPAASTLPAELSEEELGQVKTLLSRWTTPSHTELSQDGAKSSASSQLQPPGAPKFAVNSAEMPIAPNGPAPATAPHRDLDQTELDRLENHRTSSVSQFLTGSSCTAEPGATVLVLHLNGDFEVQEREANSESSGTVLSVTSSDEHQHPLTNNVQLKSCGSSPNAISVSTKQVGSTIGLVISASDGGSSSEGKLKYLRLDRPNRLVVRLGSAEEPSL